MTMTTVEKIREQLLDMARGGDDRWDLVELWHVYCEENNYPDDIIHYNNIDNMDEYFSSIADFYHSLGDYQETDDFFAFDGYGIINSFDCLDNVNSPVDFDLLAEFLAGDVLRCEQYGIEIDAEEDEDE